ncbi:MAG TPA: hypothetical protein VJ837_03660 [Candidatus Paceibacterota bacterium]|nr:hypothetical protein [Candidatus Paceibacterota bacterium]
MLTLIKILFIVVAGIFLVSFLEGGDFSLTGNGESFYADEGFTDPESYTRSYDTNNDGVVSEREYREGELGRIEEEVERLEAEIVIALQEENQSPYRDLVELQASGARSEERGEEYVVLETGYDNTTPVNITGWHLKSLVSGRSARIGKGVRVLSGNRPWFSQDDIYLAPDDRAYVATGGAAGIGTSFLVNECVGYLDQGSRFTPSLSRSCPLLEDEDLDRFGLSFDDFRREREYDACVDAIENVGTCERVSSPDRDLTDDCRDFIREYSTYEGCVKLHRNDVDFLGNEWRIFLNANRDDLWREEREAIALIDENGLIVDVERY